MATITKISLEVSEYSTRQGMIVFDDWNWVVEGSRGRIVYPKEYHECMVRKMYTERIEHLHEIPFCNGCSGASRCDR